MSYSGYEKLNPSDILQSDDYIGNDFDYGFAHWKYIDKIKTSKGWRYIYKKTKSAGKTIKKGAKSVGKALDNAKEETKGALGNNAALRLANARARYKTVTSDPSKGVYVKSIDQANWNHGATRRAYQYSKDSMNKTKELSRKYGLANDEYKRDFKNVQKYKKQFNTESAAKREYEHAQKQYDKTVYGTVDRIKKKLSKR